MCCVIHYFKDKITNNTTIEELSIEMLEDSKRALT